MHYVPKKIREIDEKLSEPTIEEPAAHLWDAVKIKRSAMTVDEMIEAYIVATDRKKRTEKLDEVLGKAVKALEKGGFFFKFGDKYLPVMNALNEV